MRRNTATTKAPNGLGGVTGVDGEVDTVPAFTPKIDNAVAPRAVNGVTAACDAGATEFDDEATTIVLADVGTGTIGECPDVRLVGAVGTPVDDTAALKRVAGTEEAGGVVAPRVTGADREAAPPVDAAVNPELDSPADVVGHDGVDSVDVDDVAEVTVALSA